ncbi:MAG: hypothetical protein IPP57_23840 [Candidatus Obscuribacter sp.]|jgi:uncharacterized membrane protein YczE|nr:hypothetical protein [Candidatus Obscuribacter sp.]MDQ5964933.1 hypothetical protein [Cyanobacteriota bacterium erpe_2018_sw_39hr_WHONDRS-SW48-000098_B_bin.30]MBK7836672.1 hypothetical protein [Candidatus Obscuribacter sp.]MBK9204222.1 hypothetical protein [Candidatus Obscuribacter sp.]MBK9622629.1 hypothetical protein [Candidatus Obscuribacter sp.]
MDDEKLKLIFIVIMFLIGVVFLGLAVWLQNVASDGHDPTAMIASYLLLGVGALIFIFGIVIYFIRHDLEV